MQFAKDQWYQRDKIQINKQTLKLNVLVIRGNRVWSISIELLKCADAYVVYIAMGGTVQ